MSGQKKGKERHKLNQAQLANTVTVPGVGMPPRLRMTVRASNNYTISLATTIVSHAFGCNTPFQPYRTFTTTIQPTYLDWMFGAYTQVSVIQSRIKAEVVNTTVGDSIYTVLSRDSDVVVSTDINELADIRGAKSATLGYYSAGSNRVVHHSDYITKRDKGVPYNHDNNICTTGDPSDPMFWVLSVKSAGGGSGNVVYRVIIEYDLEFAQLQAPTP